MVEPEPPFDPSKSRYDLSTHWGRVQHFIGVLSPLGILLSEKDLEGSQKLLSDWKDGKPEARATPDAELWEAKRRVEAAVHPFTKEVIPPPFRMAAFTPVNIPICYGMLTTTSPLKLLGWHWINQTYNSSVNYSNRSGASVDTRSILESYALAVITSCSLAAAGSKLVERGWFSNVKGAPALISYVAVATAGASNIVFSRKNELTAGATVTDVDGNVVGQSIKAGQSVVLQTALSRGLFIPMPVLLLPPLIMNGLSRMKLVPSNPRLKLGVELVVITGCLGAALPAAMAMFPQRAEFAVKDLEPQFHSLVDKQGRKIDTVYSNKGL